MDRWWRAGLPGGLSLRTFGVAVPLVLFAAALLSTQSPAVSWLVWFFFAASAFLVVVIVAQMIRPRLRAQSASVRRWVTTIVLLLAGPFTITGALVIAHLGGVPDPDRVDPAFVILSVFLSVWLAAGARLSSSLEEDARDREGILIELAREKALALESTRLVEVDRQRLLEDVRRMVTDRLVATHGDGGNPEDVSAHLRALVDDAVRPLSHELRDAQVREEELVGQVAAMRVPRPAPLWSQPDRLADVEPRDAGLAAGLIGASAVAALTSWYLGAGLLWAAVPVAYSVILAIIVLLANARARRTRSELAQAFDAADRASALVRQAAWVTRRRLANTMHGEVQGRILASALHIRSMDPDEEARELAALRGDLHHVLDSGLSSDDWKLAWERLIEMWEFSLDLEVEWDERVDDLLGRDPVAGAALVAAAGEAITNAVRHGHATRVDITVRVQVGDTIAVSVTDDGQRADGSASPGHGAPGMGTATLDAVCLGWTLTPLSVGHRFDGVILLRKPSGVSAGA